MNRSTLGGQAGTVARMSVTLYHAPMSSASPIVWAMAELGIDHESIQLDLKDDKHKQPEFKKLNPMGQVPTLVDDGTPMFEGTAILIHLGEKYGVERNLWPAAGTPERMRALTWVAFMGVTLGSSLRQIFVTDDKFAPPELQHKPINDRARQQLGECLGVLDAHLDGRDYIASPTFTLADVYCSAGLTWITGVLGFDLTTTPHLATWLKRCTSREAAKAMG